ncbi:MAG: hypothetical protein ACFCD0_09515 [Gemmataceae bacterium]
MQVYYKFTTSLAQVYYKFSAGLAQVFVIFGPVFGGKVRGRGLEEIVEWKFRKFFTKKIGQLFRSYSPSAMANLSEDADSTPMGLLIWFIRHAVLNKILHVTLIATFTTVD